AGGARARVPAGDDAEPDLAAPGSTARHREDPHAARPGAAARDGGVADMSAAHEPFDELVAGHVLDALEGEDARRFAAHRAGGCAECERAIGEYQEALARLAADFREAPPAREDRKSTRLNSSHVAISYAVVCLKKKNARDSE